MVWGVGLQPFGEAVSQAFSPGPVRESGALRGEKARHRVCEGHTLEGHKAKRGSACERG